MLGSSGHRDQAAQYQKELDELLGNEMLSTSSATRSTITTEEEAQELKKRFFSLKRGNLKANI